MRQAESPPYRRGCPGPRWLLARKLDANTRTSRIRDSAVKPGRAQIAEGQRLRRLIGEPVEVSEELCRAHLDAVGQSPPMPAPRTGRARRPVRVDGEVHGFIGVLARRAE